MADPHAEANGFAGIEWLPEIVATFPRPLAHTYARLVEEVKLREPIAAVWALRDAWECAIRFVACLGLADLVQAEARGKEFDAALGALFKNNGLSLGDWAFILSVGCDGTIPTERPRLLHGLTRLYRSENGRLTELGAALSRSSDKGAVELDPGHVNVVAWRNKVFGHGVFRKQRSWYEQQAAPWIPPLHAFYRVLAPVLAGWTLRDGGPDGPELMGAGQSLPAGDHQHVAAGAAEAVVLQGPSGILGFGPLLSAQRCVVCSERHVFFYDKSQRNKAGAVALRTELLDYLQGHHSLRKGWPPALDWQERLPKDHVWERDAFDQREAEAQTQAVFHSFADEYLRPDWIMDPLWQNIIALERGYVHLEAPAGTGKSFIARAIKEREGPERGLPVLVYHILPGARSDYRTFITLLADAAKEQLDFRTQEIQAKGQGVNGLRQQFIEFLTFLMRANRTSRLILVLDGIDQVPVSGDGGFAITEFLVPAADLPKGCVIVLTGRATLREGVADHLAALRIECAEAYRKIVLDPTDPDNRSMLVRYALEMLPEELRRVSVAERIADRSRGVFLYAFHLVQALRSGAFASADELPAAELFYGAYLGRLRERVGDALYEGIYRKLLLFLTAAQAPITLDQLKSWGLRDDQLKAALVELADFIEEVRWRPWHERVDEDDQRPRYHIAHQDFVAYVETDVGLCSLLKAAHGRIASIILNRHGRQWEDVDAGNEEDVYDARFVNVHALHADMKAWASEELIRLGGRLWNAQRWMIAEEILAQCVLILRGLIDREDHPELDHVLAKALNNRGLVLRDLNRLDEAEASLRENVAILHRLAKEEGRQELADGLARALSNHGAVLQVLNRFDEAEACIREGVAIVRRLANDAGGHEMATHLATALNNHGSVLHEMKRLDEAETCLRESVAIVRRLVEEGHRELADQLGTALNNHGGVLKDLKRLEEAEVCQRESVAIIRRLVEGGNRELANHLARSLDKHGGVLRALDRLDEAQACHRENVAILHCLVNEEGRREFANNLALALNNYGLVLRDMNRLDEAEACQRENVAILRSLMNEEGRKELADDLARSLISHGSVLLDLKRLDEAEACQRESITIFRRLAKEEGRRELVRDLAGGLNDHGTVLQAQNRFEEAEACQRENLAICRRLVEEEEGRSEFVHDLARALNNYGSVLLSLKRFDEAEACQSENVAICRHEAQVEGDHKLATHLAGALSNHGSVLEALNRLDEAEDCQRENVDILKRLVETEGHRELQDHFARALSNYGEVLRGLGRPEEAESRQSESVSLYRRMVVDEGHRELANDLATALNNHSLALKALNRLDEAEARQRACAAIRHRLVVEEGRRELTYDLAKALGNHGVVLEALHRFDEAEACWRTSVTIFRHLLAEDGRIEITHDLGGALNMYGLVLKALDRLDEAEACQRENVEIRRRFANADRSEKSANDLATALNNHVGVLSALDRFEEAEAAQRECVEICRQLMLGEQSAQRSTDLSQALNNHGSLLNALGRLDEAEACQRENVEICRCLLKNKGHDEFPEDLTLALENLGWVLLGLNRLDEAEACLNECAEICQQHLYIEEVPSIRERWAGARIGLGRIWFATGRLAQASVAVSEGCGVLKRKWERNPEKQTFGELLSAIPPLADVHIAAGDWQAALADAEELASLLSSGSAPVDFALKLSMIRGQAATGLGDPRQAIQHFDAALRQVDQAVIGGNTNLVRWRDGFVYRRASALFDAGDAEASDAIEAAVDLWRVSRRKSSNSETDLEMLARSLILRGRSRLKIGIGEAAVVDAEEARALLAPLIDQHWRYRLPLAESLSLLADAEECNGRKDRALGHRSEAALVLNQTV